MTQIKKSEVLPYPAEQLFSLVTDIENYPSFISWCKNAMVIERSPIQIRAALQGSKMGIDFSFSFIYMLQQSIRIDIKLLRTGPFKRISAFWSFVPQGDKTVLSLELDYEFTSPFLGWTLTPIIKNEVGNALKEFRKRAKDIYG